MITGMKKTEDLIIAIDGHSSGGKSTFARAIAGKYGLTYVDSGAMYRAVALYALENGIILKAEINKEALITALPGLDIEIRSYSGQQRYETWLNGRNVEGLIRSEEVSKWASTVSTFPEVRRAMVDLQRKISRNRGVVMDGRDIGTVVFPEADIKIFLTAGAEIRAERRYRELIEKGQSPSYREVLENIQQRDHQDSTREMSPLTRAADAVDLDNSRMTPDEQMKWFEELLERKRREWGRQEGNGQG